MDNIPSSSGTANTEENQDKAMVLVPREPQVPPLPLVYVSPRKERKRPKKIGKGGTAEMGEGTSESQEELRKKTPNTAAPSAGSDEEHRRAQ